MAISKKNESAITIPAIELKHFELKIVGDSPLIVHAWGEKAKRMMLDKQMKKATAKGHDAKNPVEDYIESLYWLEGKPTEYTEEAFDNALKSGARFGFPATAFKASAAAAGYRSGVTKDKVSVHGAFHIQCELAEIHGVPHMREDMVRIGNGVADIRFRGEFSEWYTVLPITYNAGAFSAEQIINLFNMGGFVCGVGEWRPEKTGNFGMFHVE